jgi:negative regulator of flagellin synthesis FlgM
MRIDLFNTAASQIASEQSAQPVGSKQSDKVGSPHAEDHATLSADSTSVNSLVTDALKNPAVRQDKVDTLQQAISNGTYEVDPSKIAGAMVDERA